jgi:hypothetical protein
MTRITLPTPTGRARGRRSGARDLSQTVIILIQVQDLVIIQIKSTLECFRPLASILLLIQISVHFSDLLVFLQAIQRVESLNVIGG